jgi:hypothetical protein
VSAEGEGGDNPSLVVDDLGGSLAVLYESAAAGVRLRARVAGGWQPPSGLPSSGDARWVSATFVPWDTGPAGGKVAALWTEGDASAFRVNFTATAAFPRPACKDCTPDLVSAWGVPLLFLMVAGATVAAMALASARTRGGGRG